MRLLSPLAGLALCALLAACQPPVHLTPTAGPQLLGKVRAACATTEYRHCEQDALEAIRSLVPPVLVVICDLGQGQGKVISTLSPLDADTGCSEGGTIPNSKVVIVIAVTDQSAQAGPEGVAVRPG